MCISFAILVFRGLMNGLSYHVWVVDEFLALAVSGHLHNLILTHPHQPRCCIF